MPYPTETRTPMHCFLRIFDETSRAIRSCFVETLHKVVSLRGHDRLAFRADKTTASRMTHF